MNAGSGVTYRETDGNFFLKPSFNLGYGDLVRIVDEGRLDGYHIEEHEDGVRIVDDEGIRIPLRLAVRVLKAEADIIMWIDVVAAGGASVEYGKAKIDAIRHRVPILRD